MDKDERRCRQRQLGGLSRSLRFDIGSIVPKNCFIHATPTLPSAGVPKRPQMSSCFLLIMMQSDSIDGICATLKQCARISKAVGGIWRSGVRARQPYMRGTNGFSYGLVPML